MAAFILKSALGRHLTRAGPASNSPGLQSWQTGPPEIVTAPLSTIGERRSFTPVEPRLVR